MPEKLKVGDDAPLFEAETYGGEKISLSEILAKGAAALCFYPRDNPLIYDEKSRRWALPPSVFIRETTRPAAQGRRAH